MDNFTYGGRSKRESCVTQGDGMSSVYCLGKGVGRFEREGRVRLGI